MVHFVEMQFTLVCMHALIRLDLHVAVRLARPTHTCAGAIILALPSILSRLLALFFSLLLLFLFFFPAGKPRGAETLEIFAQRYFCRIFNRQKIISFSSLPSFIFAILARSTLYCMKWQDSAASRLRQRQNRTFATRASAAAGGSAAAVAAAAMALGGGGGARGGGRGRRNRSRRRGEFLQVPAWRKSTGY